MGDVLIAWVADGDGDSGLHWGLRDARGGVVGGDGERERITLLRLRTAKVVNMNWGGREVVAEFKGLLGDGSLPTEILARSGQ
jgi:hypothetical protein